jgi:hypothetical protein
VATGHNDLVVVRLRGDCGADRVISTAEERVLVVRKRVGE